MRNSVERITADHIGRERAPHQVWEPLQPVQGSQRLGFAILGRPRRRGRSDRTRVVMQHPTTEVDEHWAVQVAIVGSEPQLALGRHGEEKSASGAERDEPLSTVRFLHLRGR